MTIPTSFHAANTTTLLSCQSCFQDPGFYPEDCYISDVNKRFFFFVFLEEGGGGGRRKEKSYWPLKIPARTVHKTLG